MDRLEFSSGFTDLSCVTAEEFDDPSCGFMRFQLSVDDVALEEYRIGAGRSQFEYEQFSFTASQIRKDDSRFVVLNCTTAPNYEWILNTQMRIKTGTIGAEVLKVVDKDVFEFYPKCEPISIEVMSDAIATVKFEIRILNKVIEQLPTFEEGDLTIRFDDGSKIKVYRDILALHSSYIKKCTEDSAITCVEDFAREPFIEMLYQIYPTLRPIYRNIRDLAKAAVAFQVNPLIYVLAKHLVNFNTRAMSLEQKLRAAIDMELCPAIEELVYRAAQDGVWSHLIKLGFEPESFFGPEVYRKVVCPAIVAGRQNEYGVPFIPRPYVQPNFFSEESANDKSNIGVLFRSTPFYVNRGIIEVNGSSKFAKNTDGFIQALFTKEMEEQCVKAAVVPGEVLVSLFSSLYPLGPAIPINFLRAAIVFCHDHDWHHVQSRLEQDLLQQPPETREAYRDQIIFAEKLKLANMLTVSIQRAEGSCNKFANELIKNNELSMISSSTRDLIMDRVCSGWGLEPKHVNRLATREPTSFRERQIGLIRGGPRAFEDERKAATLAEMVSDYYFGPVGEICVVNK
ncbi:unnamed protein product [Cylicocyclus nassatus]|uniref:BTB domain-containing protein n=1 Tax=Cylicocyclus nassatus TaxID=53992 RepID=A0AA36M9S9_CYLNA|nr:unnamed protein product [Cylicocyclus nassatus]